MTSVPFPPPAWIFLAPVLLLAILSLLMPLLSKDREQPPDEGWRGVFYSNPDDPSLFVPKRYGIGYTLNFSNPWSWVVLLINFAGVLAPLFLSGFFVRHALK